MTDNKIHISEQVLVEAGQWVARELGGNMSRTERMEFTKWVEAKSEHQDAYIQAHKVSVRFDSQANNQGRGHLMDAAPELQPLIEECDDLDTLASKTIRLPFAIVRKYEWVSAVAASLLVVLVSGVLLFGGNSSAGHYSTEVGELQTVMLDDGSIITLNTDTSLSVAYTDGERRVLLKHGEAFFDVAKDKNRPFNVVVGKDIVRAVGTAFNVKRRADIVKVTVTEGVVEVKRAPFSSALVDGEKPVETVSLDVGAALTIDAVGSHNAVLSTVEVERIVAWRTGLLHFDGTLLSSVVGELQYYAHKEIILTDKAVGELIVGGSLDTQNIAAFLKGLELTFQIKVIERDTVIILSTANDEADLSST